MVNTIVTLEPYFEQSKTYVDLLARLEARDTEIDRLNQENVTLNQRVSALEKIIGKAPSIEHDDGGDNSCLSVINPIFEGESDIAVNIEHHKEPSKRGRWYLG